MLYTFLSLAVVFCVVTKADHNPQSIEATCGSNWFDFLDCDHDEWAFDNPLPEVHAIHRDAGEDLVDACHYGEFGGGDPALTNDADPSDTRSNRMAFTYFNLEDEDDSRFFDQVIMRIRARLWAFCNWRQSHNRVLVHVLDRFFGDYNDADEKLDMNFYGRNRMIFRRYKDRNSCNGDPASDRNWDEQAIGGDPFWFNQVPCTNNPDLNDVSCYTQMSEEIDVEDGVLGLWFRGMLDEDIQTSAWAFSNINITVVDCPPCCTGTHRNPNKLCEDLHEEINCENKGCQWNQLDRVECERTCCRNSIVRTGKMLTLPKCKDFDLEYSGQELIDECNAEPNCDLTECDKTGNQDGNADHI